MPKIGIIIQARTGSTRLPNKMLKPFFGDELLIDVILKKFKHISVKHPVILATTTNKKDSILADFAEKHNCLCFRGSEDDVLQRFIDAAAFNELDIVIRVCADNPFLSVKYIDELIKTYQKKSYNYISYKNSEGVPSIRTHYGFFTELVELSILQKVAQLTSEKFYHEHVTNYIYDHADKFSINLLTIPFAENNKVRLTIDTIEDFDMAKEIYASLMNSGKDLEPETVMNYLNANAKYFSLMNTQIQNQKK